MDKAKYEYYVYDDSFFSWAMKMVASALLTPLWIILMGLGVPFDFN